MNTTPISLLQRLQQPGDGEAWKQFDALYRPLLFVWAKRLHVPDSDAEDLVQEVLMVLLRQLPKFQRRGMGSFRAWLRTITRNKWLRWKSVPAPEIAGPGPPPSEPAVPDPVEQFWEAEFCERLVARALELMKSDFQEKSWKAVWEVLVTGKATADVAATFGMTVGAVHSARFRVLSRLRLELADMLDEG